MLYRRSIFFAPIWTDDPKNFCSLLRSDGRWEPTDKDKFQPRYLMPYAARIARDASLFSSFSLKAPEELHVHMYQNKDNAIPGVRLEEVRSSCFGTGAVFMEFWVSYPEDASPDQIADFVYRFKKATHAKESDLAPGECRLYECVLSLLPEGCDAQPFFTSCADFKRECLCYHYFALPQEADDPQTIHAMLLRLRRSYNRRLTPSDTESNYDMIYEPYAYDHWAGSSEGLVNIACECDSSRYFLHNGKESQLSIDIYFAYLLLLNQRFSAISYISMIARSEKVSGRELDSLNHQIVALKTVYAFNIISDDLLVQNIYGKMYSVMDVDRLLEDIRDNENQMEILQSTRTAAVEKMSNKFLFGISLLSLFSALIDASSFFDRIAWLSPFATALGIASTAGIAILCIIWIYHSRNK